MTGGICEWCSAPLTGNQIVSCSPSHRLKRWRWLHGIPVSPSVGVERPPSGSPLLDGPWASERRLYGAKGASRVSTSGLQVAVGRMLVSLQGPPAYLSEWSARAHVAGALSERQRQRFEA